MYIETNEAIHIWEGYFDETKDVFNLIASLLEKAIKKGVNVKAKRI